MTGMTGPSKCDRCGIEMDAEWYSLCYDPEAPRNIWGGDTHQYLAVFCEKCAHAILDSRKDAGEEPAK